MRSRVVFTMLRLVAVVVPLSALLPATVAAQAPAAPPQETAPPPAPAPTTDIFDVVRAWRGKPADAPAESWDWRNRMTAFAPVLGSKPSSGLLLGAAGNVAFYRGDPATTSISSMVASVTFSTKGQTAITDRFTMFGNADRWRLDADHRFQWTSLDTYDLGTSADTRTGVLAKFDFFRLHHTAFYRLRPNLFAGAGLFYDNHTSVKPDDDAEAEWADSPYVEYSERNGLPLDAQTSAGTSLDLLWDSRDGFITPTHGVMARASYRTLFDDFLGGDSSWQKLNLDARTYVPLSASGRQTLAFWMFGDLVVGGVAPYFDLPATGLDTYGRSARGYSEGQFRGEKLAYGEIEYRATLTRNGLLGMVAFLNTTTVSDKAGGEKLFDSFATAGGAGLRLLINKRSRTNLCFDLAFGKQGSRGVYLAVQEAF
jgi:outer membrane protein assembly factor BamA